MAAVRLTQLDGKLPNLALMRLSAQFRERRHDVRYYRSPFRQLDEPQYERVYGSTIFSFTQPQTDRLRAEFPDAIIGGTGGGADDALRVEQIIGEGLSVDYSHWPDFTASLGFSQRGCRLKCGFCVVRRKEGKPRFAGTINEIWRKEPWPKHIHLLDNDFFGVPEWPDRIEEIRTGNFHVCFNQGINVRFITDEAAAALATVKFYDDGFETRRLYTAWDNLKDEDVFFRGIDTLERHRIRASCVMAYMLVGYDKRETWERIFHRFERMTARGIRPFPMVFENKTLPLGGCKKPIERRTLKEFQRWVIRKAYNFVPFENYDANAKGRLQEPSPDLFEAHTTPAQMVREGEGETG